jgi:hypothetical protein
VRPSGFSSYHGYRNLLAKRIHVWILGHARRIQRSYLHDLCAHDIQACYRGGCGLRIQFLSRAFFGYFNAQNLQVAYSTSRKSLPMGVKRRVYYLVFTIDDEVDFLLLHPESSTCIKTFFLVTSSLSGAWSALPMGVAPEAMMGCLQPIIDSNKSELFHLLSHQLPCLHIFWYIS